MKLAVTALATAAVALVTPALASAATLTVDPAKPCYREGETVNLLGAGFTPLATVQISRNGSPLSPSLPTDASGAFLGELQLGGLSRERTLTYQATDTTNPALIAPVELRASALDVSVRPTSGNPGRRLTIRARGFTTGKRLWAHVRRVGGRRTRNIKLGRLKGDCRKSKSKRRLFRRGTASGAYRVQFDTFRRFRSRREVKIVFSVNITRTFGAAAARASGWTRVD